MLTHTHVTGAAALCAGAALITGVPRNELVPLLLLGVAGGLLPDVDVPYARAAQVLAVVEGGMLGAALGWLVAREILPAVAGGLAGSALGGAGLLLLLGATTLAPPAWRVPALAVLAGAGLVYLLPRPRTRRRSIRSKVGPFPSAGVGDPICVQPCFLGVCLLTDRPDCAIILMH